MVSSTRRQFSATALLGVPALSGCLSGSGADRYEAVAAHTWQLDSLSGRNDSIAIATELVGCATLAPSSHNTQCWTFSIGDRRIAIRPDLARRCPAVDPDDHHVFVGLGCALENLVQAAPAHRLVAEPLLETGTGEVLVALAPAAVRASPLYRAIPERQCTRGDYDGQTVSREELALLERAGTSGGVEMLVLTERPAMERVLEHVVQGNTAQVADPAFVRELESWIRFNGADAARTGDGLFSGSSGNPALPSWVGRTAR